MHALGLHKKNAKKQARDDVIWRLERFINYGVPVTKLRRADSYRFGMAKEKILANFSHV